MAAVGRRETETEPQASVLSRRLAQLLLFAFPGTPDLYSIESRPIEPRVQSYVYSLESRAIQPRIQGYTASSPDLGPESRPILVLSPDFDPNYPGETPACQYPDD
jgi:hypothetical protein